jgi:hypothetical protein
VQRVKGIAPLPDLCSIERDIRHILIHCHLMSPQRITNSGAGRLTAGSARPNIPLDIRQS